MQLKSIIKLIRPEQWLKNFFVFLPIFFNGKIVDTTLFGQSVIAFLAFSFTASAIYCFNDIYDLEADKLHPKKRSRPLAAGAIKVSTAYLTMIVCLSIAITLLILAGGENKWPSLAIIGLYFVMNLAYCIQLKHYAIVDVLIIAIGFVLRVILGGIITGIWLSEWIVMMTFLLALFLAFAKRRDDVILYQDTGILPRNNTNRYNLDFLNQVMTVVSTITIIAYIMYTLSPEVIERFKSRYVYITSVFVLAGIIRYLQVTIVDAKSGNPTAILWKDRFIQLCILAWIVSFLIIIYL